jgi:myosin heavy subunit
MTTVQKVIVAVTVTLAVAAAVYEARQVSLLRRQVQSLQQQHALLAEQARQLRNKRDYATSQLAALRDKNDRLSRNTDELLKLRAEVSALNRQVVEAGVSKLQASSHVPESTQQVAWKLREPRRIGEFNNVGNETPEATAETVLWAAFNHQTSLFQMVHLPPEVLARAQDEGLTDLFARNLASDLVRSVSDITKNDAQQVWLDGGDITMFTQNVANKTYTYANVIDYRLSGRDNLEDPATEHHNDLLFAKIDGVWKLVIPGLSPEIRER